MVIVVIMVIRVIIFIGATRNNIKFNVVIIRYNQLMPAIQSLGYWLSARLSLDLLSLELRWGIRHLA